MRQHLGRFIVGSFVLAVAALGLGGGAERATAKNVQLDFNGQVADIVTTAPDVATFLINELGGYDGLVVNPKPATELVEGDVITVTDPDQTALHLVVSQNLKVALTPPPAPAPEPKPAPVIDKPKPTVYSGLATWYRHGSELTTASRQFPKGTKLRVIAVSSGKSVDVVVNDYGPQATTGIALDLNSVAFSQLAPLGAGKIQIKFHKL